MAQKCFPLNDVDYLAEDLRLFHAGRTVGVMQVTGNDFHTVAGAGMQTIVGKGVAYLLTQIDGLGGVVYANTDNVVFNHDVADALFNRYDAIIIRYDKETNACALKLIKGTPSSEPTKYIPKRSETEYELVIKYVYIVAGVGTITNSDIKDAILNEELCGIAVDTLAKIPTKQYDDQMKSWISNSQADFKKWFDDIKNQLTEDAAGNLQNQINSLNNKVNDLKDIFVVMEEDSYIPPEERKIGRLYFNTTDRVESGFNNEIRVSPNMGLKKVED